MAIDYGSDISTFGASGVEVDPLFPFISGPTAVLQACARRLMTPLGFFDKYPTYGYDLREQLGRRMTPITIARMKPEIQKQLELDERVRRAEVVDFFENGANTGVFIMRIRITLAEGPFTLVLQASSLTVDVLESVQG